MASLTFQEIDIAGRPIGPVQSAPDWSVVNRPFGIKPPNVPAGAEPSYISEITQATFGTGIEQDWRVKLSLPEGYENSQLMSILAPIGGFVFPYTPSISISHSATYQTLDPTHTNYPFLAYTNSKINEIQISGDFYCENSEEAKFWIASVHYLRSVSKMHTGTSKNNGAPPPIVKLNGYGDYVFKDVPVVVRQFTVELQPDVDYIATELLSELPEDSLGMATQYKVSRVPVKSRFSVSLHPLYSREQVRQFSLDKFVKGDYVFNNKGFI